MYGSEIFQKCLSFGTNKRDVGRFVLGVGASVLLFTQLLHLHRMRQTRRKIQGKRRVLQSRKEQLRRRLEDEKGILLTVQRTEILSLGVEALLRKLQEDELDPLQVLQAFQAKALSVDQKINAVCDFILEAEDWANSIRSIPRQKRGALYGLPISVKECFYVKGYDSTIGLAKLIGFPAKEDSSFIKFIKDAHGVPFCFTNIPQTMVSFGCSNPVYGMTVNPHAPGRTPGGSSGGEGALIAAGASLLGLGSDIGGSVRIPSHFCGVVGLKPTNGRIYEGGRKGGPGSGSTRLRPCITSVAGFMSSSVAGVRIGMETLLNSARRMSREDWRVVPLHWQDDLHSPGRKLRIGWYDQDGFFPATPGCTRAVREVVQKLEEAGHTVVHWDNKDFSDVVQVFLESMTSDLGYHTLTDVHGEIIDQSIEVNILSFKTPLLLKPALSLLLGLVSDKLKLINDCRRYLTRDLFLMNARLDELTYQFTAEWTNNQFDIVICPAFPIPAPPPQYPSRILPAASYTGVYNSLGCPVGVLPVTRENEEDQKNLEMYPIKDDLTHKLAYNATKGALGCPIGVQVVGRHYQEELVLHAMQIIEDLVKYDRTCTV